MARKFTECFLDECERIFLSGKTLVDVGYIMGCHADNLSVKLRHRGVITTQNSHVNGPANKIKHLGAEVISLFNRGFSVNKISQKLEVSRTVVKRCLIDEGIKPLTKQQSALARWSLSNEKSRKAITQGARDGLKGRKVVRQVKFQQTPTPNMRINNAFIGAGENELSKALDGLGVKFERQVSLERYKIDFLFGSVPVEVMLNTRSFDLSKVMGKRMKDILDAHGCCVVVLTKSVEALVHNVKNILADIDFFSRNKFPINKYGVIRCYAVKRSIGKEKANDGSTELSSIDFFTKTEWKDNLIR